MDLGVSRSSRDGGTILPNKQRLSGTDARARARRQLDLFRVALKRKRSRVVTCGLQAPRRKTVDANAQRCITIQIWSADFAKDGQLLHLISQFVGSQILRLPLWEMKHE